MKQTQLPLILFIVILSNNFIHAQLTANVFESPNLSAIIKDHKSIAILPLDVLMKDTRKKKKRASEKELAEKANDYQKIFQNAMYSWFLKRQMKEKIINIQIQDVDRTNAILNKNGIESSDDLDKMTREELAIMLGVDALFGGNVSTTATFSKGGARAIAILTNISVKTGDADVFIKLWNGSDGEMIWSFDRTVSASSGSSTEKMVDYLMKRVSKRFPYNK